MRVTGSGTGGSSAPKKKKPAPKKKAAKAAPAKGKAAIKKATYQVPKKMLKNTSANRIAGGTPNYSDVKKMSLADYKEAQAAATKASSTAAKSNVSGGSDWDKGAGWMDKQFNKNTGKKVSSKGKTKGKWWNPFD